MLEELEKAGVDMKHFINKHVLLMILPDLVELVSLSIRSDYAKAGKYNHKIKHDINRVIEVSQSYGKKFFRDTLVKNMQTAEQYGILADKLYELTINNETFFTNDNQD